jgi:hypothetical protein
MGSEASDGNGGMNGNGAGQPGNGLRRLGFRLSHLPNWLGFWLPIATALVSLYFAISGYVEATRDPEVVLVMPDQVRVTGVQYPDVYIQPTFISTGNNRVEVIRNMTMRLEPLAGGAAIEMDWVGRGAWEYDAALNQLTYKPGAEAGPMLVSPTSPQVPVCVFRNRNRAEAWKLPAGDYRLTITAVREVATTPLQVSANLTVSQEQADEMVSPRRLYIPFDLKR